MRDVVRAFLNGTGRGIITTAEADALGCSSAVPRGMVRSKELIRVARGVYVSGALMHPPRDSPLGKDRYALVKHRHRLRTDALLRLLGPKVAVSHQSAVLAWGLPTMSTSLDRVHLVHTVRGRTARRHDAFTIHTCELDHVITRHEGRLLVVPSLAVIGQALTVGLMAGVMAMDAGIQTKRMTRTELDEMIARMRHTPRLGIARKAAELADGLAESPGETRLRLILIQLGFTFIAQHWVRTQTGAHYRVDFYLPELGVILEYDGEVKYGGSLEDAEGSATSAEDRAAAGRRALAAEKAREDDLRLDGFGVGRVTSSKLTATGVRRIIVEASKQAQPRSRHRKAEPPSWVVARRS